MVEIAVPVRGELVVPVPARVGDFQRTVIHRRTASASGGVESLRDSGSSRNRRNEVASAPAELVAGNIQQRQRDRIDRGERNRGTVGCRGTAKDRGEVGRRAVRWQNWNRRIDIRSQRISAALARSLVVHVEVSQLGLPADRAAEITAENVLLQPKAADEVVVGIERSVAEILPNISVETGSPAFQDGVDVAASVPALRGIIEAGADFEFLNVVGVGNRREGEFAKRIVRGGNSLDQVVVVIFSSTVNVDTHIAAAQRGGIVQVRRSARGERKQLLEIPRRQRQACDCSVAQRLPGGSIGGVHWGHF